ACGRITLVQNRLARLIGDLLFEHVLCIRSERHQVLLDVFLTEIESAALIWFRLNPVTLPGARQPPARAVNAGEDPELASRRNRFEQQRYRLVAGRLGHRAEELTIRALLILQGHDVFCGDRRPYGGS